MVEPTLELCLSHHDELRSCAVQILFSLMVTEWHRSGDFGGIQADVIDRLDKLFSSRQRDDVSVTQALFVGQLRGLFDAAAISAELRAAVGKFLDSVAEFLDLLLGIRNLPEGEEWTEDRIVGTLRCVAHSPRVAAG
jgi:dedicator of cytokinesis protein 3